MAGLSTFQSGPKGSEVVNLFDNLGPFLAHLDTFGPFQTKIIWLPHRDKVGFGVHAFQQKIIFRFHLHKKVDLIPKSIYSHKS